MYESNDENTTVLVHADNGLVKFRMLKRRRHAEYHADNRVNLVRFARLAGFDVVRTVHEALELLTGLQAGEKNAKGQYPKKTLNALTMQRLSQIAELVNGSSEDE